MKNNKNRDLRPIRKMHVIFSEKYLNPEQIAVALINRQINDYPVAVCIRSDCDAYHSRSILNYLDPRVEIFRIPADLRILYLIYAIMVWRPTLLHWHNIKTSPTISLIFWGITQITTHYTHPNLSFRRTPRMSQNCKSEQLDNSTSNKRKKIVEKDDMCGRQP